MVDSSSDRIVGVRKSLPQKWLTRKVGHFFWCARHGARRESAIRLDVVSNW